jgi:DeoR/GlpR family transcriptional regulator of sugar metabolism
MRWFEEQRLKWIGDRLASHGHINRSDLMEQFQISMAQASKDLNAFLRERPNLMVYNRTTRRYEFNYRYMPGEP